MKTSSKYFSVLVGATLCTALLTTAASAKGPGGGGHEPPTTLSNNLSVPTIMIGGGFTGVSCPLDVPGDLVAPSGDPVAGYPIDPAAYYYVQRINTWQAQCYMTTTATATAEWGDNLDGDAALKVGSPIRVELGLFDATGVTMDGYTVVKLEPALLDRESAYGTLASGNPTDGFAAIVTTFDPVRIYDAGVTFSILHVDSGTYVVDPGTNPTAEINAGGAVVYGYNLRVTETGDYTITFTTPSVTITGVDAGTYDTNTVSLTISVVGGGGGGGGGGGWGKH